MIGTLARKRTNLVALMAIFALVAALFVSLVPANAAPATGDITHSSGFCWDSTPAADPATDADAFLRATASGSGNFIGVANTAVAASAHTIDKDGDGTNDSSRISCTQAQHGMAVKVTPNGTPNPIVDYSSPSLELTAKKAGSAYTVTGYVKNANGARTYSFVRVFGETDGIALEGTSTDTSTNWPTSSTADAFTVTTMVPLPGATGTQSVSVMVKDNASAATYLAGTASFTVGETAAEADKKVATATLELGNSVDDDPLTSKDESEAETGVAQATSTDGIYLKLTVTDSDGEPTPDGNLTGLSIVGRNASLTLRPALANGNPNRGVDAALGTPDSQGTITYTEATNVKSTMYIVVKKAVTTAAGQVSVDVQVTGSDNSPLSNAVTLTFTGATSNIAISEAPDRLKVQGAADAEGDSIKFTVTGTDKGGSDSPVDDGAVTAIVRDSSGAAVANPANAVTQAIKTGTTEDPMKVEVTVTTNKTTKVGAYTLDVILSGNAKTKQSAAFSVAGPAANIAVSADPETGTTVGELVTISATVTDEAGVNLPDGTDVTFSSTTGGGAAIISAATSKTKDGVATATLGVSGPGTTFVFAISGEARGNLTFTSSAGAPEPAPEPVEPMGADCLGSTLDGPSDWDCEASTTLGEVSDLLGGEIVSIWTGSGWASYTGGFGSAPASTPVTDSSYLWIGR